MVSQQVDLIGYLYALSVAAGGVIGFVKAGSVPSLVAGLSFGILAALGAFLISTENNHLIMLCTSSLLGVVMGMRYYKGRKFMPAGLVFIMSALMLLRSICAIAF